MYQINKNKLIYDFLLVIIILSFSSIYQFIYSMFLLIAFFILSFYVILTRKHIIRIKKKYFQPFIFFLLLYVPITFLISSDTFINYIVFILKIICIFILCLILENYSFNMRFFEVSYGIMLFYFILYLLLIIGFPFSKSYYDGLQVTIYSNLFTAAPSDLFSGFYRFGALFTEPGITQIIINLCLFYYLILKKNFYKSLVLSLMVVATMSTMGYIVLFAIWVYFFIFSSRKNILWTVLFSLLLLLCIVLFVFLVNLFIQKMDTGSFALRLADIIVGIDLILEKPILGWGYVNEVVITERMSDYLLNLDFSERSLSNGLLTVFVNMGVFFFVWYIYRLYKSCKGVNQKNWKLLLFILVMGLINEPLEYTLLYMLFLVGGSHEVK